MSNRKRSYSEERNRDHGKRWRRQSTNSNGQYREDQSAEQDQHLRRRSSSLNKQNQVALIEQEQHPLRSSYSPIERNHEQLPVEQDHSWESDSEPDEAPLQTPDDEHHANSTIDNRNHRASHVDGIFAVTKAHCAPLVAEIFEPIIGDDRNYVLVARHGPCNRGTPNFFKITRDTIINNGQLDFNGFKKIILPSHVVEVLDYEPQDEKAIDRIPPHDASFAKRIFVRMPQPPAIEMRTIITESKFHYKSAEYTYYDPIMVKKCKLRKQWVDKLLNFLNVKHLKFGTLFTIKYIKYGPGTRWIPSKDMYFTTAVETPFINIQHEIVPAGGMVATVVDVSVLGVVQSHDINVITGLADEFVRVGKLLTLAVYLRQCATTNERKFAIIKFTDKRSAIQWSSCQDGQFQLKVRCVFRPADDREAQASAQCYVRGGVVGVRKVIPNDMSRRLPVVMTLTDVEFNDRDMSLTLICAATVEAVIAGFGTNNVDDLHKMNTTLEPFALNELAWPLIKALSTNKVDLLLPYRKNDPNAIIFKACFGVEVNSQAVAVRNNITLDSSLTANQKNVVSEFLNPSTPIVCCEAPAGTGKTKIIATTVQELNHRKKLNGSSLIPLLVSHSNSPLIQAARAVERYEYPPLVLASNVAAANKRNQLTDDDASFTLLNHLHRLKLCKDLSHQEVPIVDTALEKEREIRSMVDFDLINGGGLHPMYDLSNQGFAEDQCETLPRLRRDEAYYEATKDIQLGLTILLRKRPPVMIAATASMAIQHAKILNEYVEIIMVDEATTLPLIHMAAVIHRYDSVKKLVVVGDTRQLKVYLKDVPGLLERTGYQSTFDIFKRGVRQMALTTNFRFHPSILAVIKNLIYPDIELVTGTTAEERNLFSAIQPADTSLPIVFVNAYGKDKWQFPLSCANREQTDVTILLLLKIIPKLPNTATIAVLCMYNKQKEKIIKEAKHANIFERCVFSTVEGFQGHEADIVVLVTTKTTHIEGNNFINQKERMHTAITRAKSGLIIIGKESALWESEIWSKLLEILRQYDTIFDDWRKFCGL
uniref:AAA_12 domain-containing protein n=1 Tax=Panagrellus redivivus TaxID=6233 RepID=A0A7E4ZSZ4_PANRE